MLHFEWKDYTVSLGGKSISLLRKEYMLLQYLFQQEGLTLTRTQLLNAVWADEYPSDRTVDDHIYRLRKKLKDWQELRIETVKGTGYRLTLQEPAVSPIAHDKDFQQITENLLNKYHLYGQGDAIFTLVSQTNLSFPADEEFNNALLFMQGDAEAIINNTKVPFSSKALFLIHFYLLFSEEEKEAFAYWELALEKLAFSASSETEATILAPVLFSLLSGELERADSYIQAAENKTVDAEHGFYPFLQLNKLMLTMLLKQEEKTAALIKEMDSFFDVRPYLRELALLHVLKGLHASMLHLPKEALEQLEKGMHMIKRSKFKSHQFFLLKVCCVFFKYHSPSDEVTHFVHSYWSELISDTERKRIAEKIKNVLNKQLL